MKTLFSSIVALLLAPTLAQAQQLRGMYVDGFASILGNTTAENELLLYSQTNGINYLALYDLWPVHQTYNLTTANTCTVLASFIARAHTQYGITQVGATGENLWFFENIISAYQNTHPNADERFDVYNVEFEFWNTASVEPGGVLCTDYLEGASLPCTVDGAFTYWMDLVEGVNTNAHAHNAISEVYVGWFDNIQGAQFAHAVDRILLHDYVTSEANMFPYISGRLVNLATGPTPTNVAVLFSAEPDFLGPYLQTNAIDAPFVVVNTQLSELDAAWTANINLIGYQWFAYSFMPAQPITGINEVQHSNGQVYPNPTTGVVHLNDANAVGVTVYCTLGQQVMQCKASSQSTLNLSALPSGVYVLAVQTADGKTSYARIVKTDTN